MADLVISQLGNGGYIVRPPTNKLIKITSNPSGVQVYLGKGPGFGQLFVVPSGADTELVVEAVAP